MAGCFSLRTDACRIFVWQVVWSHVGRVHAVNTQLDVCGVRIYVAYVTALLAVIDAKFPSSVRWPSLWGCLPSYTRRCQRTCQRQRQRGRRKNTHNKLVVVGFFVGCCWLFSFCCRCPSKNPRIRLPTTWCADVARVDRVCWTIRGAYCRKRKQHGACRHTITHRASRQATKARGYR